MFQTIQPDIDFTPINQVLITDELITISHYLPLGYVSSTILV